MRWRRVEAALDDGLGAVGDGALQHGEVLQVVGAHVAVANVVGRHAVAAQIDAQQAVVVDAVVAHRDQGLPLDQDAVAGVAGDDVALDHVLVLHCGLRPTSVVPDIDAVAVETADVEAAHGGQVGRDLKAVGVFSGQAAIDDHCAGGLGGRVDDRGVDDHREGRERLNDMRPRTGDIEGDRVCARLSVGRHDGCPQRAKAVIVRVDHDQRIAQDVHGDDGCIGQADGVGDHYRQVELRRHRGVKLAAVGYEQLIIIGGELKGAALVAGCYRHFHTEDRVGIFGNDRTNQRPVGAEGRHGEALIIDHGPGRLEGADVATCALRPDHATLILVQEDRFIGVVITAIRVAGVQGRAVGQDGVQRRFTVLAGQESQTRIERGVGVADLVANSNVDEALLATGAVANDVVAAIVEIGERERAAVRVNGPFWREVPVIRQDGVVHEDAAVGRQPAAVAEAAFVGVSRVIGDGNVVEIQRVAGVLEDAAAVAQSHIAADRGVDQRGLAVVVVDAGAVYAEIGRQ